RGAYENSSPGQRFRAFLDEVFPGMRARLEADFFNHHSQLFPTGTYLLCLSEHVNDEDATGRLSMWRAYGRGTGVAIVMNSAPFLGGSDVLKAYTSPVAYLSDETFVEEFAKVVDNVEANRGFIARCDETVVQ